MKKIILLLVVLFSLVSCRTYDNKQEYKCFVHNQLEDYDTAWQHYYQAVEEENKAKISPTPTATIKPVIKASPTFGPLSFKANEKQATVYALQILPTITKNYNTRFLEWAKENKFEIGKTIGVYVSGEDYIFFKREYDYKELVYFTFIHEQAHWYQFKYFPNGDRLFPNYNKPKVIDCWKRLGVEQEANLLACYAVLKFMPEEYHWIAMFYGYSKKDLPDMHSYLAMQLEIRN